MLRGVQLGRVAVDPISKHFFDPILGVFVSKKDFPHVSVKYGLNMLTTFYCSGKCLISKY